MPRAHYYNIELFRKAHISILEAFRSSRSHIPSPCHTAAPQTPENNNPFTLKR
jgi:hypothetical protein